MTKELSDIIVILGGVLVMYMMIGMALFVFTPSRMILNIQLSRHAPDIQNRYVLMTMLLWPATFWIHRRHQYLLERRDFRQGQAELRNLMQEATKSALQGNPTASQ